MPSGTRAIALMIIAIDGPAAAGKSTAARALARELHLPFLDTGAMYRAVTLACLRRGVDVHDDEACGAVARAVRLAFDDDERVLLDGEPAEPAIRGDDVTMSVSFVSAHPSVRAAVVPLQRQEAARRGGIVAEGRDIGSVVFPRADAKFYLAASAEVRAERRTREVRKPERYREILEAIRLRDHLDSTRRDSPLVRVPDAIEIDTDRLDAAGVVRAMLEHVERLRG